YVDCQQDIYTFLLKNRFTANVCPSFLEVTETYLESRQALDSFKEAILIRLKAALVLGRVRRHPPAAKVVVGAIPTQASGHLGRQLIVVNAGTRVLILQHFIEIAAIDEDRRKPFPVWHLPPFPQQESRHRQDGAVAAEILT